MPRVLRPVPPCLLAAVVLSGCGTAGADLMIADRSGSVPGAKLQLRVIDDGQVICNGVKHDLPSQSLIDAREIVRDLAESSRAGLDLPPRSGTIFRFRVRTEAGTVAFSDNSPRQPQAFYRAQQLIRTIAKGPCGLRR
jgi:hypothetical protein